MKMQDCYDLVDWKKVFCSRHMSTKQLQQIYPTHKKQDCTDFCRLKDTTKNILYSNLSTILSPKNEFPLLHALKAVCVK